MSASTDRIRDLRNDLCNRLYDVPGTSSRSAYANLLRRLVDDVTAELKREIEMDQDKSDHRCR